MKNYSKVNRIPIFVTLCSAFLLLISTFTITDNGALHLFEWTPTDMTNEHSVFVNMGNGKFIIEDLEAGETLQAELPYTETGTYSPIVEATELYDDDTDPPDEMVYNNPSSGSTYKPATITNPGLEKVDLGNKLIKITPVRNMVESHNLTYIVTYENKCEEYVDTGEVIFNFDTGALDFIKDVDYPNSEQILTPNGSELKIEFANLDIDEQRNIFLKFKTIGAEGMELTQVPQALLSFNIPTCNEEGMVDELTSHNVIVNGHDPNLKSISPTEICKSDTIETIKFRIDFQNEGDGPVKDIKVTDEIDILIPTSCMSHFEKTNSSKRCSMSVLGRNLIFKFEKMGLRGTKEAGVDIDDTKGFVEFELPKSCLDFQKCGALMNQASIEFDCNPPIKTSIAKTRMACDTISCELCVDSVSITLDSVQRVLNAPVFSLPIAGFTPSAFTDYHWYPASGLSDPRVMNPTFTDMLARDYVLVASGQCNRQFVYVKTKGNCTLDFTVNITPSAAQNCSYDIEATAIGNISDPDKLIWQDCEKGPKFTDFGLSQKSIYISVEDPVTGCYKEKWVPFLKPLYIADNPCDDQGNLQVSGGTAPYSYNWSWKNDDQTLGTSTLPYVKTLTGKSDVQVTVSDSNGCSATSKISNQNCGQIAVKSNWWKWGLALVAVLALLYMFLGKRNPE